MCIRDRRGIPGELLVRNVGVVVELARRFDELDAPASLTDCKFGSPCGGVEGGGKIDAIHLPALFKVGFSAGDQQVPGNELRLGAVQEVAGLVNLEGDRCVFAVHDGNATLASPNSGRVVVTIPMPCPCREVTTNQRAFWPVSYT